MSLRKLLHLALALFALPMLVACGGGGGGSPPTYSLTFDAPGGTDLANGQANNLRYGINISKDIALKTGITVTGRVLDGAGQPIDQARVSFRPATKSRDTDRADTNGNGDYSVTLFAGKWIATIDSNRNELGTITVRGLTVTTGVPALFDFQFPATESVTGSVLGSLGTGLDSAQIKFAGRNSGAQVDVQCAADGTYTAALCPDTYDAVVKPVNGDADTQLKQRFTVEFVVGPVVMDFALTAGVQVSGTVFDDAGLALLEDTKIRVNLPAGSDFFAPGSVRADPADGTYTTGPVPLEIVVFQIEAPGHTGLPLQRVTRTIAGPTAQTEDFTLARGFVLSGTILRDDGLTAAPKVKVAPMPTNGSLAPDDAKTDDLGVYAIALFAGTYNVRIEPKTDNQQLPEIRKITIDADTTLDVILQRGVMLEGTVRHPDGFTLADNIRVEIPGIMNADDTTNGNGMYSLLVPVGTHTLVLTARDGSLKDMALESVAGVVANAPGPVVRDITLVLAINGKTVVSGTVLAADGITPVAGTEVVARNGMGDTIGRAFTDAAGRYVLVVR